MTEELKQLRDALRRVKYEAVSLADAQVIALETLAQYPNTQNTPGMTYTLVTYRPDGMDTCRGCVMATTSSDFDLQVFSNRDTLVSAWAKAAVAAPDDREYAATEFTLLLNGLDSDHDYWDESASEERRQIADLVNEEVKRLEAIETERKRLAEEQRKQESRERIEASERRQLADLQKKYGYLT